MKVSLLASIAVIALVVSGCNTPSQEGTNHPGVSTHGTATQSKLAPNFLLPELNASKVVSLKTLLAEGHPVIVNAFASWCVDCMKEAPELQKLSKEYQGKVTFVGVDTTDSLAGVKKFVQKFKLTYPILVDQQNAFAGAYGIIELPDTYVINPSGRLVTTHQGILSNAQAASIFASAAKLT